MAKAPAQPKIVKAAYVTMPAKSVVVYLMDDGSVTSQGCSTRYAAWVVAHARDPQAFEMKGEDFIFDGATSAFDRCEKKK